MFFFWCFCCCLFFVCFVLKCAQELKSLSYIAVGEVDLACVHIEKLIASGVPQDEIAVIAPYNLQVFVTDFLQQISCTYVLCACKQIDHSSTQTNNVTF